MRQDISAVDAAIIVPLQRWDLVEQESSLGVAPIRFSMFLDDVSSFDAAAFSLSENEATLMDPQQRLLLECVGEALMDGETLQRSVLTSAGVFVVRFLHQEFYMIMETPSCMVQVYMDQFVSLCRVWHRPSTVGWQRSTFMATHPTPPLALFPLVLQLVGFLTRSA